MKWELEQIRELWNFVRFHMEPKQCGRCFRVAAFACNALTLSFIAYFRLYCFSCFHWIFNNTFSLALLLFNFSNPVAYTRMMEYWFGFCSQLDRVHSLQYIRLSRISVTSMIVQLLLNHKTFRCGRTRSTIKFPTNAKAERAQQRYEFISWLCCCFLFFNFILSILCILF